MNIFTNTSLVGLVLLVAATAGASAGCAMSSALLATYLSASLAIRMTECGGKYQPWRV